jgi:hypothetical protein
MGLNVSVIGGDSTSGALSRMKESTGVFTIGTFVEFLTLKFYNIDYLSFKLSANENI